MSSDVVVIGGGIIGTTVAYDLAKIGAKVTLLERGAGLGRECSSGNAGMVTSTHAVPLASPSSVMLGLRWMWRQDGPFKLRPRRQLLPWLARFIAASTPQRAERAGALLVELFELGIKLHASLADSGLNTSLVRRGMIDAYETEAGVQQGRAEIAARKRIGLSGALLTGIELHEAEPALRQDLAGGAFFPDEAHCDPLRFTQALGTAARELGVEVRCDVEVLDIEKSGGHISALRTTAGRMTVGEVVLAAGVWSPQLTRKLGIYLPIQGAKGYHVEVDSGSGTPGLPVYMMESKVVATPLGDRLRLSGTFELDGTNQSVDPVRVDAIHRAGKRHFPAIRSSAARSVWRGLRPCPPDGLPLIGRPDSVENLVVATGHGAGGTAMAPVTAKIVSELVQGVAPTVDLSLMRPDRFRRLLSARTTPRNGAISYADGDRSK